MSDCRSSISLLEKLILLEKKYADFGFDWPDTDSIFKQILSEVAEVKSAITQNGGFVTCCDFVDSVSRV